MTGLVLGWLAVAMAADHACDAAYSNACVDPSASLTANTVVEDNARVGPGIVADDVVVGARAVLDGRFDGPVSQPIGDGTVIGRRAVVGADADIGTDVSLGRASQVGENFLAGAWSAVGYASVLGDRVELGTGAVVGSLVTVGDDAVVTGVVARGSSVGAGATVSGVVGPDVQIGADAVVQGRVRKQAVLADGVHVAADARVGRGVSLGYGAVVDEGASVSANAVVAPCTRVQSSDRVSRGESWEGAAVSGCFDPDALSPFEVAATPGGSVIVFDATTDPATGDVYITGEFGGGLVLPGAVLAAGGSYRYPDVFVAAFEGDGTLKWARGYPDTGASRGSHIEFFNGNVYLTGEFDGTLNFDGQTLTNEDVKEESFVARIDRNNGDRIWIREIETTTTSNSNRIRDLEVTSSGIYIVGTFNNTVDFKGTGGRSFTTNTNGDGFFARISSSGSWQAVKQVGGDGTDRLNGIGVLPNGNLALAGMIGSNTMESGSNTLGGGLAEIDGSDGLLIIVSSTGSYVSGRVIPGPGSNQLHHVAAAGSYLVASATFSNSLSFGSSNLTGRSSYAGAILRFSLSGSPSRAFPVGTDAFLRSGDLVTDGTRAVFGGYFSTSELVLLGSSFLPQRAAFVGSLNLGTGTWEWVHAVDSSNPSGTSVTEHSYLGDDGYIFTGSFRDTTQFGPYHFTTDGNDHGFWFPIGSDGSL